jgi:tryptophan-rich sensory protein
MTAGVDNKRSWLALIVAAAASFAAGALGRLASEPNLPWYHGLAQPGFAPPDSVFSYVWAVLYAMMAVAAWQFWRAEGKPEDRKLGLIWFGIQLALNAAWPFAFFALRSPGAGLVVILLLLVAIVITIAMFDRLSRVAALLLVPYLLWVCFATALNFAFWFLNS